jgi:hypothetical protein
MDLVYFTMLSVAQTVVSNDGMSTEQWSEGLMD